MTDSTRPNEALPAAAAGKKPYHAPTLTECGSVAKLTMQKGTTTAEISQIIRRSCL